MTPARPVQTVFDLDGRQAVEAQNNVLEDQLSDLRKELYTEIERSNNLEASCRAYDEKLTMLTERWNEMSQAIDQLTRYDLSSGGCDESACAASMKAHKHGDYLPYDEVSKICGL